MKKLKIRILWSNIYKIKIKKPRCWPEYILRDVNTYGDIYY